MDRATELQAFAVAATQQRRVQRVLLFAPEGLGRSMALSRLASEGAVQWSTTVVTSAVGPKLGRRIVDALGSWSDDPREAVKQLSALPHLAALEDDRRQLAGELLSSLRTPPLLGTAASRLDADARQDGAAYELMRWLKALAKDGLLLALDDVHRAAPESLDLIDAIAGLDGEQALLFVLSADSQPVTRLPGAKERLEQWQQGGRFQVVTLLPREPAELSALLKQSGCEESDVGPIVEASRGNVGLAFALLEQVRKQPQLRQDLPQTLLALRLVRLKSLGETAYEAARVAAVLGDTFPQEVLYACADLPLESVDTLVREGVLKESANERMPLLEFVDWRDRAALSGSTSVDGPKRRASVFCARMLDLLNPQAFAALNQLILPLALPALPAPAASFWREAEAATRTNRAQAEAALTAAAVNAVGIRKLVLTRRVADLQLAAGQPDRALATLNMAGLPNTTPSPLPPDAVGEIISGQQRAPLDCWESLNGAEAQAAFALVKAEALSQLVKTEDCVRAFDDARRRLEVLKSPLSGTLWVRWAKGWSWFASEILGRAEDAVKACDEIRKRVGAAVETDADALGFLRAEQVARTSAGDFARGKDLVDKQVRMAERRGQVRDLCLASNARAILHFGEGELLPAREGFVRAVELARASSWARREAISLHNLSLVLCEHGELDAAQDAETEYARLSEKIGNHAGQAEAPLVLASVAIAKERYDLAKQLITQARSASELNGWHMLGAWSRALLGRSVLAQALARRDPLELAKARNELAAALEALEDTSTAWTEELDPGEVYSLAAVAQLKSGHGDLARQVLERGAKKVVQQNVVATRTLALGQAAATGRIAEALVWFEERQYVRLVTLWKKIAAALA